MLRTCVASDTRAPALPALLETVVGTAVVRVMLELMACVADQVHRPGVWGVGRAFQMCPQCFRW